MSYECDQRHADLIVSNLGLTGGNSRVTPGIKCDAPENYPALSGGDRVMYRSNVARGIYISQDRPDISFAVEELSRQQSCPVESEFESLKRLGRYLTGSSRLVQMFRYQDESQLVTYVDTIFAGCLKTRKSTSGGMIMHGSNVIKHWSSTQYVIALPSGDAEHDGLVKGQ